MNFKKLRTEMAHLFSQTGYNTLALIGQGAYGKCYKVQHQATGQIFAVKVMTYTNPEGKTRQLLVQEMKIHRMLAHPNIVRCVSATHDEDAMEIRMFSEFCSGGDLHAYVQKLEKGEYIPEDRLWSIMGQILCALKYCHSPAKPGFAVGKKVVHRDLKPANIMLTDEGVIKLCDFGFAREIDFDNSAMTLVGSPMYMAPEVFQGKTYDEKCDIWSLGGVMHFLASKLVPYLAKTRPELEKLVLAERRAPLPKHYSKEFVDTIGMMMRLNPEDRPSAADLLDLPRFANMFPDQDVNEVTNLDNLETGDAAEEPAKAVVTKKPMNPSELAAKITETTKNIQPAVPLSPMSANKASYEAQIDALNKQLDQQNELLLEAEKNIGSVTELAKGRLEMIASLRYSKNGRAVTDKGETALILAVKVRDYELIKRLLPLDAGIGNNLGKTALMYAADMDDATSIRLLLSVEGGMQDNPGGTALMRACNGGKVTAASMLLMHEKGLAKKDGSTALIFAIMSGSDTLVDLLVPYEAGMAMKDGRTALMSACFAGRFYAVKRLVEKEFHMKDSNGKTCIYYAERGGHKAVIDFVKEWAEKHPEAD